MSSIWNEYTLDEVCFEIVDCVNKTAKTVNYETPYKMIRTTNVKNGVINLSSVKYVTEDVYKLWTRRSVPKIGDVILTREAPIGEIGMVRTNELVFLGQRLMQYRANLDVLDPFYLLYALQGPYLQAQIMSHEGTGSTVSHIRVPDAMKFKILLPSLEIQKKIGDILGSLDDKIELNHRLNENLEQMGMALYKHWFVDFGPFQDGGFVESELGQIPKGWNIGKVGEILELTYGKALKADHRKKGSVPVFGSSGCVGWHNESIVEGPGIIVGRKGTIGTVTLSPIPFYPIDTSFYVTPKIKVGIFHYLYHFLKQLDMPKMGSDSAVPGLNRNTVYMCDVVYPPLEWIIKFENQVREYYSLITSNNQENVRLKQMRDYLLPRLLSGDIEVQSAEEQIQEVLSHA